MSDYTMKSNSQLDEKIRNASSVEEIREITLASLAASGVVTRDRVDPYDVRLTSQAPVPLAPAAEPAAPVDHNRVSRFIYPGGNDRLELFGADEAEIAEKEKRIRALY